MKDPACTCRMSITSSHSSWLFSKCLLGRWDACFSAIWMYLRPSNLLKYDGQWGRPWVRVYKEFLTGRRIRLGLTIFKRIFKKHTDSLTARYFWKIDPSLLYQVVLVEGKDCDRRRWNKYLPPSFYQQGASWTNVFHDNKSHLCSDSESCSFPF